MPRAEMDECSHYKRNNFYLLKILSLYVFNYIIFFIGEYYFSTSVNNNNNKNSTDTSDDNSEGTYLII